MQLSKYVLASQCEVIASLLRTDGALRIYSGTEPDISTSTEGRLVSCPIVSVEVNGAMLTIKYESATVTKEGSADYLRLVSGNIPVLSDTIPDEMMSDRALKIGTIVDSGFMIHNVIKSVSHI